MLQIIKRQFQVQWREWMWGLASVGIVGMAAGIVTKIVLWAGVWRSEMNGFPMGTLLAGIVAVFYALVMEIQVAYYFNLEIGMGSTRKQFFAAYYIVNVVFNLLFLFLLMAGFSIENAGNPEVASLYPYFFRIGPAVVVVLPMVCGFAGALTMRFGKKAFWVMWLLWMFAFLGVPQISDAAKEAPNSLFGMLGNGVGSLVHMVPTHIWIALGAAGSLICFAGTYLILRKQEVRL